MNAYSEWLASLSVGGEVALDYGYGGVMFTKIERETAKYWVVSGAKYRKDDGALATSDRWSTSYLRQPTSELKQRTEDKRIRSKAQSAISSCTWRTLTTDQLTRIAAIIAEENKQ